MRLPCVLALVLLAACTAGAPGEVVLAGHTMGTTYNVKLLYDESQAPALQNDIEDVLDKADLMMSTYKEASELSRFNARRSTDWQPVSPEFCASVEQALRISKLTDGAFDITVAPLVDLWGFGPGKDVTSPPPDADIARAMAAVGYERLHSDCGMPALRKDLGALTIDMSAFGKGLAVDRVAELLDARGVGNYLVEVGGELRLRGHNLDSESWAVGIELPRYDERRPYTIVHLTDTALATSGDYRNFFEWEGHRYSHTIDTRTGRPVTHSLASVTVVDPAGSRADALATALLVLGPDEGMQFALREELAVLFLIRDDGGIDERSTPAFDRLRSNG